MAKYNLINTGIIISNTVSGTGNVSLTTSELRSLYDDNTTSSGVGLTTSDVLYLDIDIGYRIKIDDFKLFIDVSGDRATALTNVDFYYKNNSSDVYTLCAKSFDSTTFYPTGLPTLFAPRIIRVVVDTIECSIRELIVMNDDTQVSFGEDGTASLVYLRQEVDGYDSLGVFNNSSIGTTPVTAYVIVDSQGEDSDFYISLSNSSEGPYYDLNDGVVLNNNDLSHKFIWDRGIFENVKVHPTSEVLMNTNYSVGYYTTPVLEMGDIFDSTFLMSDTTLVSGTSITWDEAVPQGTIKIKSDNTAPLAFTKLFWLRKDGQSDDMLICEADMGSGNLIAPKKSFNPGEYRFWPTRVIFDRHRSEYIAIYRYQYTSYYYYIRKYNYNSGSHLFTSLNIYENTITNIDVDSEGRVWFYALESGFRLVVLNYSMSTRTDVYEDNQTDFLGDLSADKGYSSCWYTNKTQNKVYHIKPDGEVITSFAITNPTYICSLYDGGCMVVNSADSKIIRYNYNGDEISYIDYNTLSTINDMSYGAYSTVVNKSENVFWVLLDNYIVMQLDFDGNIVSESSLSSPTSIEAFPGGCSVYSSANLRVYQLNSDGELTRSWSTAGGYSQGTDPYPVVIEYDEFLTMDLVGNLLPLSTDLIWNVDNNWSEVTRSGYKLPFKKYHQIKYKLTPYTVQLPIENPGAETGDLTGWTEVNSQFSASTDKEYTGVYSFKYGEFTGGGTLYQRFNMIDHGVSMHNFNAGILNVYVTSKWISTLDTEGLYGKVGVKFYDIHDNQIGSTSYGSIVYGTSWKTCSHVTDIPADTIYMDILVYGRNPYSVTYYGYFDDIEAYVTTEAVLNSVIIPKPIKLIDLQPQEYKDVYIKTEFPEEAAYHEYETRLKCWWGNEEE